MFYRADIEWQDADDEEAEVPGQQRPWQDHPVLPPQIPITLQQVEGQQEDDCNHHNQSGPVHGDNAEVGVRRSCWRPENGCVNEKGHMKAWSTVCKWMNISEHATYMIDNQGVRKEDKDFYYKNNICV